MIKIPDLTITQTLVGIIGGLLTIILSVLKIRKMTIKDTETFKAAACFDKMNRMLNDIKDLHSDNVSVTIIQTVKRKNEPTPIFYKAMFSTDQDIITNFGDDNKKMEVYLNRHVLECMIDDDNHAEMKTDQFQDSITKGWAETNDIKSVDMFLLGIERNYFKRDENGYFLLLNRLSETSLSDADKYDLHTEIIDIKDCFKKNLID